MSKIVYKSFKEQGIFQKLIVAIMLMVIIPVLLMIYLLYSEAAALLNKDSVQLTIFLIIASSCCGYILSRNIIIAIIKLTKEAQGIAQGNLSKRIETAEQNEISALAEYFNQITGDLEKSIADLQESKRITQNVLLRIGKAITSEQKSESILGLTLETLVHSLGSSSGAIMLLEKNTLHILIATGLNEKRQHSIEIRTGEGITGWVAKEKKALKVTRAQQDRRFDVEVRLGLAHKSFLCAPLLLQNKLLGTISIHDKKNGDEFTADDLFLLENLASQTAIAIENSRLNQDIERTYIETISALALAVEAKDPYSRGHSKRVSEYVKLLGEEFSLDKESIVMLEDAALLHDIGKIGVKDEVLLKPAALNAEEKRLMHRHAIIGESILKPIHSLNKIAYLVRHHQEQVDGKGYPDGLTGELMTLPLKILIVADAYDAMTSDRPYRKGMSKAEAKKELKKYSGIYFDPHVVEALNKVI